MSAKAAEPEAPKLHAKKADKTGPETITVTISRTALTPPRAECKVGDTVCWTNSDDHAHVIKFSRVPDGAQAGEGMSLPPSKSGERAFTIAGEYEYGCEVNPAMRGSVMVS